LMMGSSHLSFLCANGSSSPATNHTSQNDQMLGLEGRNTFCFQRAKRSPYSVGVLAAFKHLLVWAIVDYEPRILRFPNAVQHWHVFDPLGIFCIYSDTKPANQIFPMVFVEVVRLDPPHDPLSRHVSASSGQIHGQRFARNAGVFAYNANCRSWVDWCFRQLWLLA